MISSADAGNTLRGVYIGLAVLVVLVWLTALSGRPLFNPDEGRYAEIPREMLAQGDWVIPHLNGLDYIEKPPLQYWATAISYSLFGVGEFSARLYTALTALASIGLIGFVAARLWDRDAGWRAAAVLAGMFMFAVLGQLLTLDMSLTCWMTVSLAGFLLAQQSQLTERRWMLIAWAGAALGVLTKGLVAAAIPTAVLVIYSLWSRDFSPCRKLHAAVGLPLFLLITVPWHWAAATRLDDFLQFFFVHEHFARYLTPVSDRQESWWFFGAVFLAGTIPWTVPALRVLFGGWRTSVPAGQFDARRFLWIWVVFIVIFFSLSDSKLMPYILPTLPALALLIASLPASTLKRDLLGTAILTTAAAVALGIAAWKLPTLISASLARPYFLLAATPLREVALLLLFSGLFVWLSGRDVTRGAAILGVGWCLAVLLLMRAAAVVGPVYSGADLAKALPASERDAPLFSVRTYDQSLPFYLRRTVTLVSYRGELDYGLRKAPEREIADVDGFLKDWESRTRAYAVMDQRTFDNFKERNVPMRIIGQNVRNVVVARQ